VLTVLCRPGLALPASGTGRYPLFGVVVVAALLAIGATAFDLNFNHNMFYVFIGVLVGLTVQFWRAPLPFAPHKQAGHMTAPDQCCIALKELLPIKPRHSRARGFCSFATHGTFGASVSCEIVGTMIAEDCRKKAAEQLHAAAAATDPKTSASLRRLADAWATLAAQIEEEPHAVRERKAALKQSRQTEPGKANADTIQVADILRERLQLSDSSGLTEIDLLRGQGILS
jgi:hypothetical protein